MQNEAECYMPTWQLTTILDDFNFSHVIRKTPGKKLKTKTQKKYKTELPNTCNQLIYNQIKVQSKKDSSTSCKLETITFSFSILAFDSFCEIFTSIPEFSDFSSCNKIVFVTTTKWETVLLFRFCFFFQEFSEIINVCRFTYLMIKKRNFRVSFGNLRWR